MIGQELLQERRNALLSLIRNSYGNNEPHIDAFVARILNPLHSQYNIIPVPSISSPKDATYEGYPYMASLGYFNWCPVGPR